MQAYSPASVQQEIHYHVHEQGLEHKISSTTEKIIQLDPSLLLGTSNLFNYDSANHQLVLTPPFRDLLKLLVELGELDDKALSANSLYELNSILQKPQGQGGFMRKEGTERWHLEDNSAMQTHRQIFDSLLQQLGFVLPNSIDFEMSVDHCLIFGARTERMETRIIETLGYLKNNLSVTGHIFLLGSNRKLIQAEIEHLKSILQNLDEHQKIYWSEVFEDSEQSTEANAFACLWECIVPQETQALFDEKLVRIKSTRIGHSYNERQGHRVTAEVTAEDWMLYYQDEAPQAIFALAEQPYLRLADQLRSTVLSKGKMANIEELVERIKNTTFYFASPKPRSSPLVSVIFDEIGRNVYRTVDTLKYLEKVAETEESH